jgi:hypothetical protein
LPPLLLMSRPHAIYSIDSPVGWRHRMLKHEEPLCTDCLVNWLYEMSCRVVTTKNGNWFVRNAEPATLKINQLVAAKIL